jgi:hypothetical protein
MKELLFILAGIIVITALIKLPDLYLLESRGIVYRISQEEVHAEIETFPARLVVFERLYLDKLLLNGSKNLTIDLNEFVSELRKDLDRKGMEADIEYLIKIGICSGVNDTLNAIFDGSSDPNSVGVSTEAQLRISSRMADISGKRSYIICIYHPYKKICFDRIAELLPRNSSLEESAEFNDTDEIEKWVNDAIKRYRDELERALDRARTAARNCSLNLIYNIEIICNRIYPYKYILIYRVNAIVEQEDITLYYYGGSKKGISEKFVIIWQIYLDGKLSKISESTDSAGIKPPEGRSRAFIQPR